MRTREPWSRAFPTLQLQGAAPHLGWLGALGEGVSERVSSLGPPCVPEVGEAGDIDSWTGASYLTRRPRFRPPTGWVVWAALSRAGGAWGPRTAREWMEEWWTVTGWDVSASLRPGVSLCSPTCHDDVLADGCGVERSGKKEEIKCIHTRTRTAGPRLRTREPRSRACPTLQLRGAAPHFGWLGALGEGVTSERVFGVGSTMGPRSG